MSRDLDATLSGGLTDSVIYPFYTIDLVFDEGPLYLWTRQYAGTVNNKDYFNSDDILDISQITETNTLSAEGITITFSGTTATSLLNTALSSNYQGRPISVGFGLEISGVLYVSEVFSGEVDTINIVENFSSGVIETSAVLTAESILLRLNRPTVRRFNAASQQARYPQDLGLSFVNSLANKTLTWGKPKELT